MTGDLAKQSFRNAHWQRDRNEQRRRNVESAAAGCAVYVRGVPASWSVTQLQDLFTDRWPVESINLLPRKADNRARAAFVNFSTRADAEAVVATCDGHLVEDAPGGDVYWLACSLKRDAHKKVDVDAHDFSAPSEILENFLYLGNRSNAKDSCSLETLGISHILSVLAESDREVTTPPGVERLILHCDDSDEEDLSRHFASAVRFLKRAHEAGGRVLAHCVAGRSRSASLVLAYLMHEHRMPLNEAFALLKEKRPAVLPNHGFWSQLEAEELKIFGEASPTPLHYKRSNGIDKCPADHAHCTSKPAWRAENEKHAYPSNKKSVRDWSTADGDLVAHLPPGALHNAPRDLLHQFQRDLCHFSELRGVAAQLYLGDRKSVV